MGETTSNDAKRETRVATAQVSHPAAKIFPLLCPTKEYDWLRGWHCKLVYSRTGVAERGCIFKTDSLPKGHPSTWVVDVYQPDEKIQFCIFAEGFIIINAITLFEKPGGTTLVTFQWTVTALDEAGRGFLEEMTEARFETIVKGAETMLNHYLDTGKMLPA